VVDVPTIAPILMNNAYLEELLETYILYFLSIGFYEVIMASSIHGAPNLTK
jgi:hypothetical protein